MKKARFFCIFCPVLLVLAIAALTVGVLATASPRVRIMHMGSEISGLLLSQEEKTALNAECDRPSTALRWQILADAQEQLWVDIHGASGSTLTLSYALVGSLLDNSGSAYIRCAATADGALVVSEPVYVTVAYTAQGLSAVPNRLSAPVRSSPVTQEDTPSADEYIQITINYLDAVSGLPIYTPYYAQIEVKKDYASDVISPTYLGYAPYYNASMPEASNASSTDDASIVHISLDDTHEAGKYIVNVYYKAIDVPYAVRYFFQNINDDLYTENSDLYWVGTAKTGTIIDNLVLTDPVAGRVQGFTKLYHYPEAVAADGSTVFECYYDRNYYMLKFDAAGGHGTETIYARYGTPFVALDPTRYGYKFMGWDSNGDGKADEVPATVPSESRSYTAIWVPENTNYKVVYWLSHADDSGYAYIGSRLDSAPSDSTVSGSGDLTADTYICGYAEGEDGHSHTDDCKPADFRHYVFDHADQNITVKGNGTTIVNVYYKRKEYTLRFFYAKETTGSDNSKSYMVIGGSTYNFGNKDQTGHGMPEGDNYTIENLLDKVDNNQYGKVEALPVFTTEYKKLLDEKLLGKWSTGTVISLKGVVFHYFSISLPYGADLTELWPGEAFQAVEVSGTHNNNGAKDNMGEGKWGNYAYLAGWNGEFKVKYSVDNANSTVKGMYQLLDDNLLYDKQYGIAATVNFIGFFDNGADISWSVPRQWIYKIYIPKLNYDEDAETDFTHNGIDYRLLKTVYTTDDNTMDKADATAPYGQTQPTLLGFTADGAEFTKNDPAGDGRDSFTASFFYRRNTYALTLHNHGEIISNGKMDNIVYNAVLTDVAKYEPSYPASLEAGAYRFAGWYYSQDGYAGSELGETDTMPAHNLSLYAKWVPVEHTLRFFESYGLMLQYERGDTGITPFYEELIPHRSYATRVDKTPTDPSGNNYIFAGWFYLKNGEKTAFDPFDIEVTSDMHLFADWSSQVPQPFLVHYALYLPETDETYLEALRSAAGGRPEDNAVYRVTVSGEAKRYVYLDADKGYHLCIADDSSGFAYEGSTRTYYPKAGDPMNQLYTGYSSGYYPTLASHSITIAPEDDKTAPKANVFTFTYVYAKEISYKVEYRYAATSQLIDPKALNGLEENPVTKTTSKAVITERFHVVENYIPDAFYKRLILSVTVDKDGNVSPSEDNVITFYYTKNTSRALYVVQHLMQKLGTDGTNFDTDFEEIDARIEGIADIGSNHSITPQTFSGFTVMGTARVSDATTESYSTVSIGTDGTFSISVTQKGTELYLYYTRNTQSYKVYHLRNGTDISDLSNLKEADILAEAETYSGKYGQTVTARKKGDIQGFHCVSAPEQSIVLRNNDANNYIIFYYAPLEYTAQYRVWSYGGGTLDRTLEVVQGGSFQGSTPTALAGYRFAGWFTDASCTMHVDNQATVDNATNQLTPKTEAMRPAPETNVYYAKFVPEGYGSLTITRRNTKDESDGEQVFVYRITAVNDPSYITYVTVRGSESVTVTELPCRDYTVEQLNTGWSWRYADQSQKASITKGQTYTCTFGRSAANGKWLSGNAEPCQNRRGKD